MTPGDEVLITGPTGAEMLLPEDPEVLEPLSGGKTSAPNDGDRRDAVRMPRFPALSRREHRDWLVGTVCAKMRENGYKQGTIHSTVYDSFYVLQILRR